MISLHSHTGSSERRSYLRALLLAAAFFCVALGSVTAVAEEDPDNEDVEEKLDDYWSVDRDLETVQQRAFERDGRFSGGLFAGMMSSEPYFYYLPVGARASYHFNNHLGVGLEGSFTNSSLLYHNTDLTDFLEGRRDGNNNFDPATDTEDRFLWRSHAVVNWSPLYGKLAFLQRKLAHFDFNLTAGAGVVGVQRPDVNRESVSNEVVPEAVFGGGVQFFATPKLSVRADGRLYVYKAATTPTNEDSFMSQMSVPAEFLLGVDYMF